MLYIASALTPTPILDTLKIDSLTSPSSTSLVVAKPDRVEVWDVDQSGLVLRAELEMWGSVVAIEKAIMKVRPSSTSAVPAISTLEKLCSTYGLEQDAHPHILVLLAPPNAQLLLLTFSPTAPRLIVTSSIPLTPPTSSLRQAEFFTSVISQDNAALVSLWVGVLSCVEMEIEKEKDAKKRRASVAGGEKEEEGKRLKFRDNFNINIREHNLLHLSFLPPSAGTSDPMLTFMYLSSTSAILLQARRLSLSSHSFLDTSKVIDLVSPTRPPAQMTDDPDFADIPFSCPAARRVLPIPTDGSTGEKYALVIGDEYSVLYSLGLTPQSPRLSARLSVSGSVGDKTSPRGAQTRRSPQNEMVGGSGKRRKGSVVGRVGEAEQGASWSVRPVWRIRQGFGTVLAAAILESHTTGASVILADECGRLTAVGWEFERGQGILDGADGQHGTVRVRKVNMGVASPASSLTYLSNSHLFLSSSAGDSQLLRLSLPSPTSPSSPTRRLSPSSPSRPRAIPRKGKSRARREEEDALWAVEAEGEEEEPCTSKSRSGKAEIAERWMNLAPVKDFVAVKEDSGGVVSPRYRAKLMGQSHLVVASGASNSNSLRVVRSGVGVEDVMTVEGVEDVQRMWPVMINGGAHLLLSTSASTILLAVDPEIRQVDLSGAIADQPTLACADICEGSMVLAHPTGVSITRFDCQSLPVSWAVDKAEEVVAAHISGEFVAVAKRGGEVVILGASSSALEPVLTCKLSSEISAISILSTPNLPTPIIAIATWTSQILIYTLSSLSIPDQPITPISESVYATSLQLKLSGASSTSSGTQLLAGMSDGGLIVYDLEFGEDKVEVKGRKVSSLGTRPLRLCGIADGLGERGEERVVGVGLSERLSVVFESKERLDFSSASKKDVQAATSLLHPTFGPLLVLATAATLTFTKINSLKKLSVQTLDLKERSAQKLVCVPEMKLLGMGVTQRRMDRESGEIEQSGFFELRDSGSLQAYDEMPLLAREEITTLQSVFLLGKQYIAIGTAIFGSEEEYDEATFAGSAAAIHAREGRVLLVEPQAASQGGWRIEVVCVEKTVGPVHALAVVHGFLVIAAASKARLMGLHISINRLSLNPSPILGEVSSFASTFIASQLHVLPSKKDQAERLVIGDGMRSVFILEIDEESGKVLGDERDMATHGVMGLEGVSDGGEGVIISDAKGSLLTFRLSPTLEAHAPFALKESVVRFIQGSLAPQSSAPDVLKPDLLFATQDGRLGVIGELGKEAGRMMDEVQRNLARAIKGPGGIGWGTWRKGGVSGEGRDTAGWVDGDFVQKFMNAGLLSSGEQEKVLIGTNQHERVTRAGSGGAGREAAEKGDVVRLLEAAAGLH